MQSSPTFHRSLGSDLESFNAFNVVMAYEDLETGKHAKCTYDFLVERLGHECQFHNQMWKFDVLGIPELREMASRDAALADIVIISCHGSNALPHAVKSWIEGWLSQESNPVALVALFDTPFGAIEHTYSVRTYLAGVAKRGGMEFFAQPDLWPGQVPHKVSGAAAGVRKVDKTLIAVAGAVQREQVFPHWGINE